MSAAPARRLPAGPVGRSERLRRERTAARLRRREWLEAEVAAQMEPLLGPAGGPRGEGATALWRRAQVDAYLALPPWRRAWRTWASWGPARRAATPVAAGALWTVACLPLRMTGLAGLRPSQLGVAVLLAAAPVAALVPLRSRGRFARAPEAPGPPWSASRGACAARRGAVALAAVLVALLAAAAVLGPGGDPTAGSPATAAALRADERVVRDALAAACGPGAVPRAIAPLDPRRYAAAMPGGGRAVVEVAWSGRAPAGSGAGHGEVVVAPPGCGR